MVGKIFVLLAIFIKISEAGIFVKTNKKVSWDRTMDCADKNPSSTMYVDYTKCNKTHRCIKEFNVTLPEVIGPTSYFQMEGSKWSDGGWKPNAFIIKLRDLCGTLSKVLGKIWEEMMETSGMDCPIQPNTYKLKDFYVDLDILPVAFMYGTYNVRFLLENEHNDLLLCKDFVISIK